jgi:hypothetical protein
VALPESEDELATVALQFDALGASVTQPSTRELEVSFQVGPRLRFVAARGPSLRPLVGRVIGIEQELQLALPDAWAKIRPGLGQWFDIHPDLTSPQRLVLDLRRAALPGFHVHWVAGPAPLPQQRIQSAAAQPQLQ